MGMFDSFFVHLTLNSPILSLFFLSFLLSLFFSLREKMEVLHTVGYYSDWCMGTLYGMLICSSPSFLLFQPLLISFYSFFLFFFLRENNEKMFRHRERIRYNIPPLTIPLHPLYPAQIPAQQHKATSKTPKTPS